VRAVCVVGSVRGRLILVRAVCARLAVRVVRRVVTVLAGEIAECVGHLLVGERFRCINRHVGRFVVPLARVEIGEDRIYPGRVKLVVIKMRREDRHDAVGERDPLVVRLGVRRRIDVRFRVGEYLADRFGRVLVVGDVARERVLVYAEEHRFDLRRFGHGVLGVELCLGKERGRRPETRIVVEPLRVDVLVLQDVADVTRDRPVRVVSFHKSLFAVEFGVAIVRALVVRRITQEAKLLGGGEIKPELVGPFWVDDDRAPVRRDARLSAKLDADVRARVAGREVFEPAL